ncbi:hypothetical protein [Duganella sp. Root1480D1]|uniref:hypothetical protein n=1 Tax=Duganella sp. Root1480D1 TaxID=1736471 RepID=UPI0012E33782|nr:hypothetical protein [Duganella sp. Root1480D1]
MHSIIIGPFEVRFEPALVSVPRDGTEYDWICEDWVEVRHLLEIEQADGWATVIGLNGGPRDKKPHVVRPLSPTAFTEQEIVEYFIKSASTAYTSRDQIKNLISTTNYPWGKVVSLNWTALGYAPGGTEFCMLPNDGCAISLGHLALDWATVKVSSVQPGGPGI